MSISKRNIMNLKLVRTDFSEDTTLGELYIDDVFECFICEDAVRDEKIKGITAIPYGTYEVVVSYSPRFGRYLPLLLNVPNYTGVRIHKGNVHEDTEGCLLPGVRKGIDSVLDSKKAFDKLYPKIVHALQNSGKVFIEVV
jgi:hypothetical protein